MQKLSGKEAREAFDKIQNPEVEKLVAEYSELKTTEKLNELLTEIHKGTLIIPANMDEKQQPYPCVLGNAEGDKYFPVYTSMEQMKDSPKPEGIMTLTFEAINAIAAASDESVKGIVINPFTHNLLFFRELVNKVAEIDEQRRKATETRMRQVTPEQYMVIARKFFEFNYLPRKMTEQGQEFIDELCNRKETYLDELYEDSYQEKRLYPFVEEDFSVMIMDIDEELLVVRADMPTRYMSIPSCFRVYLAWNKAEKKGRYFTIEMTPNAEERLLAEMGADLKRYEHGTAPVEGAELQEIIRLYREEGIV